MSNENPKWQQVDPLRRFQESGKRRVVKTDSGKVRRVPALPFEYWMKPSGNVVKLVVMTTRNVREAVDPHRYADFTRRHALRDKWIPWDWAEVRAYAPALADGCASESDWHKRRAQIQAERQAEYNAQAAANSAWFNAEAEARKLETKEAFAGAIKDFADAMAKNQIKPAKNNG